MKFEELSLDPRILAGVKNAGFETPTPIQEQAIPQVLEGHDVLGLAQTGTGKTAAFILPILQRLTSGPLRRVRALIVAPTRELAEQIHETAVELGKHTKIRSFPVYGGVSKGPQLGAMRRGTEIIVACPGRLLDHINEGSINLSGVEVLVLDEADRMCDMGFLPDIRRLLKHLPRERQNLFFSATMPKEIRSLADEMLNKPVTVQIGMIAPAKTVSHALYPVQQSSKKGLLFSMLGEFETDQVLIFTRTKRRARFLARDLEKQGYEVCALQGNMAQNRRQEAINGFRDGKYKILVATDIAARGIDVAEISHVINFDMPDTVDAYTHRIGRTGRAHAEGEAFTFVDPTDEGMVREIEKLLGKKIERRQLAGFNYSGQPSHENGQSSRSPRGNSQRNRSQSDNGQHENGSTNQHSRGSQSRENQSRGNGRRRVPRNGQRQNSPTHRNDHVGRDNQTNGLNEEAGNRTGSESDSTASRSSRGSQERSGRGSNGSGNGRRHNQRGGSQDRNGSRTDDRDSSTTRRDGKRNDNRQRSYRKADVSNLGPGEDAIGPVEIRSNGSSENRPSAKSTHKSGNANRTRKRKRVRLPKRNKSGGSST